MHKISQAYKIGSRLALTKYLPKLSRNQLLAAGAAGGGLGALVTAVYKASKPTAERLPRVLSEARRYTGKSLPEVLEKYTRRTDDGGYVGGIIAREMRNRGLLEKMQNLDHVPKELLDKVLERRANYYYDRDPSNFFRPTHRDVVTEIVKKELDRYGL